MFGRLDMRHELHWLDITERIATTVYCCLHCMAPEYLYELFSGNTDTIKISTGVITE